MKAPSFARALCPLAAVCALAFANVAIAQSVLGIPQARDGSIGIERATTDASNLWDPAASGQALQNEILITTTNATNVYNQSTTIAGTTANVQNTIDAAQSYVAASNSYAVAAYNSSVNVYASAAASATNANDAYSAATSAVSTANTAFNMAGVKGASGSTGATGNFDYVVTAGIPYECGGPLAGFVWTDHNSVTHAYSTAPGAGGSFGESQMGQNCGAG